MPSKNSKNLEEALKKASLEKNAAKRGVKVAAVIAAALQKIGQEPVLVGGAAVEFYTEGGYATRDIDMVTPGGPELWKTMKALGFERKGKDFIHPKLEIYIEFPGESLGPQKRSRLLDVDGLPLKIISIEDLLVDRLCAYKFWKSEMDGLAALLLLETGEVDQNRLKTQAKREEAGDALEWIIQIYEEIFRKKLSPKEASRKLREWLYR